jgi:hypothetical protein
MGCGCKKKQQTTTQSQTPPPPTINVSLAESTSQKLTQSQENLVNQIVEKLKQVGEKSE